MKPEIKQKWIEALRSGLYHKAQGRLRYKEKYCCLGVLCDLASKEGVGKWVQNGMGQWLFEVPGSKIQEAVLPVPVVEWAGLSMRSAGMHLDMDIDGQNPSLPAGIKYNGSLAEYNDYSSATFEEIATVIDERL